MKKTGIILMVALVICLSTNIFAAGPIDYGRTGSIIVTMEYEGEPVGGGTMTLFHVAVPVWQEDLYVFEYTEDFTDCLLPLDELGTQDTANGFVEYAIDHDLLGKKKTINDDGEVHFENLEMGLYLLVQEEAAEGYFAASPFLISVPMDVGDEWIYDVDASPKVALEREPVLPQIPPDIPQTGQLKWPIPVLIVSGLALFAIGWALSFAGRKKKDET